MVMSMVNVGIVRTAVFHPLVRMQMGVGFTFWIIWLVFVLMVLIVSVSMFVLHRLMNVPVFVAFCHV
jgi:hypothetical protein